MTDPDWCRSVVIHGSGVDFRHPQRFSIHRPNGANHWVFVHYCTAARITLGDGQGRPVGAGWCAFYAPYQPHGYVATAGQIYRNDWLHVDCPFLAAWCQAADVPIGRPFPIAHPAAVTACVSAIADESGRRATDWATVCALHVRRLIVALGRSTRLAGPRRGTDDEGLRDLRMRLQAHPELSWTVGEMARIARLSPSRLHARFATTFGTSPTAFAIAQRIERAKLLLASAGTIAEIGTRCGFSSGQYFARQFRRVTGRSPKEWRRDVT